MKNIKTILLTVMCCVVVLNSSAQLSTNELPYGLKKEIQVREQNAVVFSEDKKIEQRKGVAVQ